MRPATENAPAKMTDIALSFWLIKIAATTLVETSGDAVSASMDLGCLAGTAIYAAIVLAAVIARGRAKRFRTGRPSSRRIRPARRWPILRSARSESGTLEVGTGGLRQLVQGGSLLLAEGGWTAH